ncbi:ankyrin repeat-containing domain protein [Aspergillus lucknowensis]|uniref:Ankyrin repeat-containing domain protein n=1 Tax=Aspergillus lucknowensis TaxID=176173 RepID=A0ABR4LN62_9EURO
MAEAIGLAVNIASVLQLATEIAQLSYSYARDVKNAPKTQKRYLQEVSALMEVLFRVEQAIQDAETTDLLPERPPSLSDDALMDCYKALSALQFDLQKRRSRLLQPFHEKEWRVHIDMLNNYRSLFADFLNSCILVTGNATYKKVSELSREQDRNLLLTWLPQPTVSVRQRPSPCPGTGTWFIARESVQQWIARSLDFLWCYGPPGVGKSCLASILVNNLHQSRVPADCPVVYFFCDFSSQDQQRTIHVLHHLLRQVIEQGSSEMLASLKEACKDPSKLQNETNVAQLIATAALTQPIYLILDALDELRDPIELLIHISTFISAGINVLVTSRDLPHIRKKMRLATHFEVESNPEDLRLYVESRFRDSDFAEEIEEESGLIGDVVLKSSHLFLLARLMLDDALDLTTVKQIRKAIGKPQTNIKEAYAATLERIDSQSKSRSSLARRLLGWVTYAERRLKLEEVLCAFAVEDADEFDPDNEPNADVLLRSCLGLVVVDRIDDTVGLVHTTAYEFFRAGGIPEKDTNLDIARTSLRYLTMRHLSTLCNTFLDYAAKNWGRHISGADDERELAKQIMKLLRDGGLRGSAFQALQYRPEFSDGAIAEEMFQSMPTNHQAVHSVAYWNLPHTAEALLTEGDEVSAIDSHKWTALHWACSRGNSEMSELLLRNGIDLNAQDIQNWTPLFWASFRGNADIVRLLLSKGANHLIRSTGHSDVVRQLLEHHAQAMLKAPVVYEMSIAEVVEYAESALPIEMAAEGDDPEVFDALIQHLQTPGGQVGDTEFNRIWGSSITMTKGEEINGRESIIPSLSGEAANCYRTDPVEWKSLSSVQLLIKAGADVNYDPRYVEWLLKAGAAPNEYDSFGRTALHEAVLNGFLETVTALIDGGADVNQPMRDSGNTRKFWRSGMFNNLDGATPLIQACGFMFIIPQPELALEMTKLLLSRGADVGLRDAGGMTVLHYALFIDTGCPVDVAEQDGRMPIHILATSQHEHLDTSTLEKIVRLILGSESGATSQSLLNAPAVGRAKVRRRANLGDTSRPSDEELQKGRAPIGIALQNKQWRIARLFYDLGATIPNNLDLAPVFEAAVEGLAVDIVSLLLDYGVRPSESSVLNLVRSLIKRNSTDKSNQDNQYASFKHILAKIVAAGADVNFQLPGEDTAMVTAARTPGCLSILRDLVQLNGDPFWESGQSFDAILSAALYGDSEMVQHLVERATGTVSPHHWSRYLRDMREEAGNDIMRICLALRQADSLDRANPQGRTLLHLAAECGNVVLIDGLLACDAATTIPDEKGLFAVHYAGLGQHTAAVQALLPLANDQSQSSHSAADTNKQFWLETLKKPVKYDYSILHHGHLIAYGMDPNTKLPRGWQGATILHDAVRRGRGELVAVLLTHGADITITDNHGWSVLHTACYNGHTDIAKMLMAAGSDIHAATSAWNDSHYKPTGIYVGNEWTGRPIHLAVMAGSADLVEILLDKGVDIHAHSLVGEQYIWACHGPTALHLALDTRTFYGRRGSALDKNRLKIAGWLVGKGAMVQGVISRFSLRDVLKFREFPDLWDALRAGEQAASASQ